MCVVGGSGWTGPAQDTRVHGHPGWPEPPSCSSLSSQGWGRGRGSLHALSTLTARVRLRKVWEGGPTVISCLPWCGLPPACQALGSLDPWAGQGPTHGALVPTVCNFMSHEKCLKHVKTPCTSVAPSLVRVRMELGRCTCTFGGKGKEGLGTQLLGGGAGLGVGPAGQMVWAGSAPLQCIPVREPLPGQQGASLPQGSDPVFSGVLGT